MNDFYLTLPSNTSSNNTTSKFSIHLPTKLDLRGNWDVALVEIQYPHSWNNVHGFSSKGTIADNWIEVTFTNNFVTDIMIPPGHYDSIEELITAINYGQQLASFSLKPTLKTKTDIKGLTEKQVHQMKAGLAFRYNTTLKRVQCKKNPNYIKYIELSERLQYMLGFKNKLVNKDLTVAKFLPDLRGGFYSLFVYCSLVEPQIVGDVRAPLLRTVHIDGNHGQIIEKLFQTPHYLPVTAKEVDRIEIEIKDDNNQFVPFQFGKTVVKLHFRKKRSLL